MGTYQTRISDYVAVDRAAGDAALSAYAGLYGQVERKLFTDVAAGSSAATLKSAHLERYEMPTQLTTICQIG